MASRGSSTPAPSPSPPEDSHTLEYYSHSNSGFTEDALSQAFVIDNTVPSVSTGVSGYTLWLNGTDALSGVLHVCYRLDGGALTYYSGPVHLAPGIRHSIEYYAIDKANNWCSHLVIYEGVQDLIAPVSSAVGVGRHERQRAGTWKLPTVTMSATDSGESGLKAIYYSIDGSAWSTYSGPITLSSQGTVHLRYYAVANASNAESIRYANITIDTLSPVLTVDLNGFTAGWGNATSTVSVTSEENGSGIAQIYYSLNNGTWMTYSAALSFSTDTRCFVQFYAVDVAGHTSTVVNVTISVDATDPTCNGTLSGLVDIDGPLHRAAERHPGRQRRHELGGGVPDAHRRRGLDQHLGPLPARPAQRHARAAVPLHRRLRQRLRCAEPDLRGGASDLAGPGGRPGCVRSRR